MKYLVISIFAVLSAVLLNWLSTAINLLIIFVILSVVLIWLFYQAQLLPEDVMAHMDNRLIHDGQAIKELISDTEVNNNVQDKKEILKVDAIAEKDSPEVRNSTSPDQELLNLVLEKSRDLDIEIHPLENLSEWISTVDPITAEREIMLLIEKLDQASGLSNTVILRLNGESLEVQV